MNQKIILTFLTITLIASFSWLASLEKNQHEVKNDWFLYFTNPQDDSLDFVIENFSDTDNFSWSLTVDNDLKENKKTQVLKNGKENVKIEKLHKGSEFEIEVSHGPKKRKIYKLI